MSETLACSEVLELLLSAEGVDGRWSVMTEALSSVGMDQVNYGVFDTSLTESIDAPVRFMSTMSPDWIAFYGEQRLDQDDPHVAFVRNGNLRPYRWGEGMLATLDDPGAVKAVELTVEAGLRSQIHVTMPDPLGSGVPVGGVTLGSSLSESELGRSVAGREPDLIALAHIFHMLSIGEVRRRHYDAKPLSARERDCVAWLASGLCIDAIADKLGVARVTVDLHLRNARRKLGARTQGETVAKALLFQEIRIG